MKLVRELALAFLPIPNLSEPGEQRYVSIVEVGSASYPQFCVGTCRWGDWEWENGWYMPTLPGALRKAAERIEQLSK